MPGTEEWNRPEIIDLGPASAAETGDTNLSDGVTIS